LPDRLCSQELPARENIWCRTCWPLAKSFGGAHVEVTKTKFFQLQLSKAHPSGKKAIGAGINIEETSLPKPLATLIMSVPKFF
jgi:hypothetical protein